MFRVACTSWAVFRSYILKTLLFHWLKFVPLLVGKTVRAGRMNAKTRKFARNYSPGSESWERYHIFLRWLIVTYSYSILQWIIMPRRVLCLHNRLRSLILVFAGCQHKPQVYAETQIKTTTQRALKSNREGFSFELSFWLKIILLVLRLCRCYLV